MSMNKYGGVNDMPIRGEISANAKVGMLLELGIEQKWSEE